MRVPKERREALLAERGGSGVSGAELARLMGMKYATPRWVAQARRKAIAMAAAAPVVRTSPGRPVPAGTTKPAGPLIEAVVEAPRLEVSRRPLAVELPGGACKQVAESAQAPWVAEVFQWLAGAGHGAARRRLAAGARSLSLATGAIRG